MRLSTATPICKNCFEEVKSISLKTILEDLPLCEKCFNALNPKLERFKLDKFKGYFLYYYDELIRSMIFNLKGCGDIELAPVFLAYQKRFLRFLYRNYLLVPAPSYREKDDERGFNHVEEIFKPLGLEIRKVLIKTKDVKQADLNAIERSKIGEIIDLDKSQGHHVAGRKILLVDDLLTTGSTAKACAYKLLEAGARKVELLVIAHTREKEFADSVKLIDRFSLISNR